MKKKCFNDKYGQTESVLNGQKTMFREILNQRDNSRGYCIGVIVGLCYVKVKYKVGEVVAVSQSYNEINEQQDFEHKLIPYSYAMSKGLGWTNKMFVKASLMPHQIEITGIKLERLQDISDEDSLKEGIEEHMKNVQYGYTSKIGYCGQYPFGTPCSAFEALADKLFGKGIWEQNPYVIAYEFKLIK